MKHSIIFALVVQLIEAHFRDNIFPTECYLRRFTNSARYTNDTVYLLFTCYLERFSSRRECLNPNEYDKSDVKLIEYECRNIFNSITTLTLYLDVLNEFENLIVLDISNLGIKKFEFRQNDSTDAVSSSEFKSTIKILKASHNKLTEIPNSLLHHMPQLTEIDLTHNQFEEVDFNRHTQMNDILSVNFSNNIISKIREKSFSNLHKLETLDLSQNRLRSISRAMFVGNKQLQFLYLGNNPIEYFNFNQSAMNGNIKASLHTLDLSNSHIETSNRLQMILNGNYFNNLKELYLVGSFLKEFKTSSISSLHELETLDVSNNAIYELDDGCFMNNPKMKLLNLEGTPLKKFDFNAFSPKAHLIGVHLPSKSIEELDISCGNSICHFKEFDDDDFFLNIRIFNVSGNREQNISKLLEKIGPKVEILDLSRTYIGILNANMLEPLYHIQHLNLSHSQVSEIRDDAFIKQDLQTLNLVGNNLTKLGMINSKNLPNLKSLKISGNLFDPDYLYETLSEWVENGLEIDVELVGTSIQTEDEPWYKSPYFIAGFVIFVIGILCALAIYLHRKRRVHSGLANFVGGDVNGLKPELALDTQTDLLPYDTKYEFPRNKLKFGKQLGAGAFGIVLEAMAQGIKVGEEETKVAVKRVKNVASNEVMRALILELKIMVHLGQHLNVVNLLGAVTKDIAKFELMVIVEFCPFGNLKSFLAKNRRHFVNQIVPDTDEIDIEATSMEITTESKVSSFNCNQTYQVGNESQQTNTPNDCMVMMDEPSESPPRSITTEDLLIWSFQIARGMDYLASRKVLHGDLAARNVLLCDDNVVKICDFGLARSLYKDEDYHYHMKTQRRLPFKWLALETLNDQVFSTHSDVWSFGITLWELFSLGATPYSGVEFDDLTRRLNDGYRLEKAEFATQKIHDIMLSCWCFVPEKRPKFSDLEKIISKILGETKSDHYVNLNEPYVVANANRFNSDKPDYLASPDCQAPSVPVNATEEESLQS